MIIGLLLSMMVAGVRGEQTAEKTTPLYPVRLQLKWRHPFQFAGYYAAIAQGYYRDAGLAVEGIDAQPGLDAPQVVLDGGSEFAVGTSDLILLRSKGEPPVVLTDALRLRQVLSNLLANATKFTETGEVTLVVSS